MIKVELLVGLFTFALWVFCVVEVISTPEGSVRNLSKTIWLIVVLLFPFVGSVAWLVAGRPDNAPRRLSSYERSTPAFPEYDRPGRVASADPERDEEFLAQVRARAEAQRRRHEAAKREKQGQPPAAEEA